MHNLRFLGKPLKEGFVNFLFCRRDLSIFFSALIEGGVTVYADTMVSKFFEGGVTNALAQNFLYLYNTLLHGRYDSDRIIYL